MVCGGMSLSTSRRTLELEMMCCQGLRYNWFVSSNVRQYCQSSLPGVRSVPPPVTDRCEVYKIQQTVYSVQCAVYAVHHHLYSQAGSKFLVRDINWD